MSGRALCALAAIVAAACCAAGRAERSWPVMGTYARVAVEGGSKAARERAIAVARETFERVDASMSNWKDSSELSRVNREARAGPVVVEDGDLALCLGAALDGAEATGGAFDPTVGPLMTLWGFRPRRPRVPAPEEIAATMAHVGRARVAYDRDARRLRFSDPGMEIDLGGIAKGCALDIAASRLAGAGVAATLDLGGAMATVGRGGTTSTFGIADPEDPARRPLATVRREGDVALATSSDAENRFESGGTTYGHLIDPATGRPAAADVVQATVLGPSGTVTDLLSTALFVAGSARASEILARYPGVEAILIVREGDTLALVASRSLRGRVTIDPSARRGLAADSPRYALAPDTIPSFRTLRSGGPPWPPPR